MVLLRVSLIRNPRKYCHCSGASQTSQKIRWMTFLPVELSYSLDSVIKDPLHCPPHPTSLPAPWMVPVPNSHRLSLLRCSPLQWKNRFRPYQSEEQKHLLHQRPKLASRRPAMIRGHAGTQSCRSQRPENQRRNRNQITKNTHPTKKTQKSRHRSIIIQNPDS